MAAHTAAAGFLAHLEPRDREATDFARQLLDDGWEIVTCWGPVQMDVWGLELARGVVRLRFGIERGLSDGILLLGDDGYRPLSRVLRDWAARHHISEPDLLSHGRQALDDL